jgi:hypothetical protein
MNARLEPGFGCSHMINRLRQKPAGKGSLTRRSLPGGKGSWERFQRTGGIETGQAAQDASRKFTTSRTILTHAGHPLVAIRDSEREELAIGTRFIYRASKGWPLHEPVAIGPQFAEFISDQMRPIGIEKGSRRIWPERFAVDCTDDGSVFRAKSEPRDRGDHGSALNFVSSKTDGGDRGLRDTMPHAYRAGAASRL